MLPSSLIELVPFLTGLGMIVAIALRIGRLLQKIDTALKDIEEIKRDVREIKAELKEMDRRLTFLEKAKG